MAMTTSSSIRVKPLCLRGVGDRQRTISVTPEKG
jgi:hypothetical protein